MPAGCGVILYFFMQVVKDKSTVLQGKETEAVQKLQILLDGLMKNQEMWLNVLAFVVVLMLVYTISRCSFDYSWRVGNAVRSCGLYCYYDLRRTSSSMWIFLWEVLSYQQFCP